jgi:hypothetical protein
MRNSSPESPSLLVRRFSRTVRDVEILRVSAQLDGDDFEEARRQACRQVLNWANRRAGASLPSIAWDLEEFELLSGGRNSAAAHVITDEVDFWALRAEDPDKRKPGRVWVTEVAIGGHIDARPHLSVRLIVNTTEQDLRIAPHVPGFVRQLIAQPGIVRGGRQLFDAPTPILSENDVEDLCDYLQDSERRLPVIVVATPEASPGESMIADKQVAAAVAGFARVVQIPAHLASALIRRFGKHRAVFNGGVRMYMPGFSETDDPFRHRLFLASHLVSPEGSETCETWLRQTAAAHSVSSTRLGREVLDFASIRTGSRRLKTKSMQAVEAPDAKILKTAEQLIDSLERELEEKDKEIDGYVEEVTTSETRAETSEQEYRALLFRFRQLREAVEIAQRTPTETAWSQNWSEFSDWLDAEHPDRVILTSRARRMIGKPEYQDVGRVARAVHWLATDHFDRRVGGGGSVRDVELEPGVRNSPCGGDEYPVHWRGRTYTVDWHIKAGGNTRNPKRCLRIYYFWEPEMQMTVIDHLPGHRTTAAS